MPPFAGRVAAPFARGAAAGSQPGEDGDDGRYRPARGRPLLGARGAAPPLGAVDRPRDRVALAARCPVEARRRRPVGLRRNHRRDPSSLGVAPHPLAAGPLVARHGVSTDPRSTALGPRDRPPLQECGQHRLRSCRSPPVSATTTGSPPCSARRQSSVEKPPWLRPSASRARSPPLPRRHAGGTGQASYPRRAASGPADRPRRRGAVTRRARGPRPRPAASGGRRYFRSRTARAGRATGRRSAGPRGCPPGRDGDPSWAGRCGAPAAAGVAPAWRTARRSVLASPCPGGYPARRFAGTP